MKRNNDRRQTLVEVIEQRISTNVFDPNAALTDGELSELIRLATKAPTAFNLQNWRFIAVRTPQAKKQLWEAAWRQTKVLEAAATFIVCGQLPDHESLAERLRPSVEAGFMPEATLLRWVEGAQALYSSDPRMQRDEAVRSATFGAATLMFAAAAFGLATGAMVGFDSHAVSRSFGLAANEIPVLLMTVGVAANGNWPQKPRRPLHDVLSFA